MKRMKTKQEMSNFTSQLKCSHILFLLSRVVQSILRYKTPLIITGTTVLLCVIYRTAPQQNHSENGKIENNKTNQSVHKY